VSWTPPPALRRYAPVLVVLAVLGALVGLLPSTAGTKTSSLAAGGGFQSPYATNAGGAGGDASATPGAGDATGAGAASGPGAGASGGSTGSTVAPGSARPGSGTTLPGTAAAAGDTSHCKGGRQFDPAIDYFAPPCVPSFTGKNPGATYAGVTADTINLVDYYPKGNPAVDTATQAQGLYVSIDQQRQWTAAVADFINSHYELYGRKVKITVVQGTCDTIPPDTPCLRNEMRQIAANQKPFAFKWLSPLTSAPFDELSALGIVNVGGQMFTDDFANARRPYHWDVHMSGTRIADEFGELWCKELSGKPAAYSGSPALDGTPGNTNGKTRVLGVIGTNDPENIKMREELDRVLHTCGDKVAHTYDASNDLSTAAAQKSASVANMRQAPESTTVLCLCNPVGAEFVYNEMQNQSYYPEIVYAGTVYTDLDDSGQAFMSGSACPTGASCTFETAFGLHTAEPPEPVGKDRAQRVWAATGRQGSPPFAGAELDWDYWSMIGSLLQGAGPNLTPTNLEQGAFAAGMRGGGSTGHDLRGFKPGSHAWNQDAQLTYWMPTKTSPFNGKAGTFVPIGPRLQVGQIPGQLADIPKKRR
jgi:hypothetical protein